MAQRRKFPKEFKLALIKMVLGRGVSIAHAAKDLDIN
jgi:transposase-like protein